MWLPLTAPRSLVTGDCTETPITLPTILAVLQQAGSHAGAQSGGRHAGRQRGEGRGEEKGGCAGSHTLVIQEARKKITLIALMIKNDFGNLGQWVNIFGGRVLKVCAKVK